MSSPVVRLRYGAAGERYEREREWRAVFHLAFSLPVDCP